MIKDYKIIIMDKMGEHIHEYYSYIVPQVNDNIFIDDDMNFTVQARQFSTNHNKVVLVGSIELETEK